MDVLGYRFEGAVPEQACIMLSNLAGCESLHQIFLQKRDEMELHNLDVTDGNQDSPL
jgi:hypothetical protein